MVVSLFFLSEGGRGETRFGAIEEEQPNWRIPFVDKPLPMPNLDACLLRTVRLKVPPTKDGWLSCGLPKSNQLAPGDNTFLQAVLFVGRTGL